MGMSVPADDFGYVVDFTIQQSNGSIYNFTGYNPYFVVQRDGVVVTNTLCNTINAVLGTCNYSVGSGVFTSRGKYSAGLKLVKTGASFTSEIFEFYVG